MNIKHSSMQHHFLLTISAFLLILASNAAMAAAGKVVYARGDVQVERAGQTLPLTKGAEIEPGDIIVTGKNGRVQLLMADGDRMALNTGSRFSVDEFKTPISPDKPETGRGFYSLIKGGFRAVTRSLGKRGLDSYRVKTPVATIGIRGTTYWVMYFAGDANNPAGYYFGVSEGGLGVGNNAGQMNFGAGQYGYVQDANSPPILLPGPPSFLNGQGDGNNNQDDDGSDGGYSGGIPLQGCTNSMAGDVNCPPTQPIQGEGIDFTPGHFPETKEPTTDR